jgi:hypothetical protein
MDPDSMSVEEGDAGEVLVATPAEVVRILVHGQPD